MNTWCKLIICLAKRMNHALRKLSVWLRANKISLNVEKTSFLCFEDQKLNDSFKIKLN